MDQFTMIAGETNTKSGTTILKVQKFSKATLAKVLLVLHFGSSRKKNVH